MFCKRNTEKQASDGTLRGKNLGYIIIIYPAFTGFPVARSPFFIFLDGKMRREKAFAARGTVLACDMLYRKRLMFVVKCPVPHDGFPLSRGAYFTTGI